MQVNRDEVLSYLRKLEEKNGGFYGTDLMNFAEKWRGLRKRILEWLNNDSDFPLFIIWVVSLQNVVKN